MTPKTTTLLAALATAVLLTPLQAAADSRIDFEAPITGVNGTVIQIYDGQVSFEARGAEIDTEDDSFKNVSDFKPGTFIEVEATVNTDGSIQARRIEVSDEKDPATEITGVIGTVDEAASTFTVGPLTVHYNGGTKLKKLSAIRAGTLIEAKLDVSGDRLTALVVEREERED